MAYKDWSETNYGWDHKKNKSLFIKLSHPFKDLYTVEILKYNGVFSEQTKKKETKTYKQAEAWAKSYMRNH